MRRVVAAGFALPLALLLLATSAAAAQDHAQWFGLWTLNLAKSAYEPGPPPYRRATFAIEPWKDGVRIVYELVHQRGGVTHLEWLGRFDGGDYTVQGIDEDVTYAYERVDARRYRIVVKVNGRAQASSLATLAPDGSSITTVTTGRGARGRELTTTTVYEKTASSPP